MTKMLWIYTLKSFSVQLNVLKVDYDGITPMEKFSGIKIDIMNTMEDWKNNLSYQKLRIPTIQ